MNKTKDMFNNFARKFEFWKPARISGDTWCLRILSRWDATENVLEYSGDYTPLELQFDLKKKSIFPFCFHCGLELGSGLGRYGAYNFCSQNCMDRAIASHRRHALRVKSRTHFITRFELMLKDNAVCGICKDKVEISQASIDHIIPISKGGRHVWDNVQLAHFCCNIEKSNKEMSELTGNSDRFMQGKYLYELRRSEPEIEQETVFEEL